MGIILGALGGAGDAMMNVGMELQKQAGQEDLQNQRMAQQFTNDQQLLQDRAALEQQTAQNLADYQQALKLKDNQRVGKIVSDAIASAGPDATDDDQSSAIHDALMNSGDFDRLKTLSDIDNQDTIAALKLQVATNAAKFQSDRAALQRQLFDAKDSYKSSLQSLQSERTSALSLKELDSFFGPQEKQLETQSKDPAIALDPQKKAAVDTAFSNLSALKSGAKQIMEDTGLSAAHSFQLVVGLQNGTTRVFSDPKNGDRYIDAGGGKGVPMPVGLESFVPKTNPGSPGNPSPGASSVKSGNQLPTDDVQAKYDAWQAAKNQFGFLPIPDRDQVRIQQLEDAYTEALRNQYQ